MMILSHPLVHMVVGLVILLIFIVLNAIVLIYMERKIAGHVQRRPGPLHVGPHGILQPVADVLKLLGKQIVCPPTGDKLLFWLAPIIGFAPVVVCFIPIPFSSSFTILDINLGIVLILAFSSLNVVALCMAGWGSNNKWSLLGAARSVAQSVAYEIPLLIVVMAVAAVSGSLKLSEIANHQGDWPWQWNWLYNPLAFVIFFICAVAETNRNPFDLPEAESELTGGFHTEYSGMTFGLFFLAEYANMMIVCSVGAVLFLGGSQGPIADGWWWFLPKMYLLLIIMMWFRWTFPRVRFDQLLNLSWKWLTPLALIDLIVTIILVKM